MKGPEAFRTISEVAEDLDLPQHVLRFWETRFGQIKPMKRGGGRRYYRPDDVDLLRGIRMLLYSEGFTIRGVQRLLKEKGVGFVVAVGQTGSVETVAGPDAATSLALHREAGGDEPEERAEPAFVALERREPVLGAPGRDNGQHQEAAWSEPIRAPLPAGPVVGRAPGEGASLRALSADGRRLLESVLSELAEAKRLLDQVR
jgi:DNA-binding transcriptional MerR regulator